MANLRIAELDFDTIKTNLKTFLQSQSEFSDYDFEGSGLSILLDVLAYNTHYNAYLANMVMNEMFLDSAVKRASAVSIAKHLGYTPTSVTGAVAKVDIVVTNPVGFPVTLTLERYTPFTCLIDGSPFTFLNIEPVSISPVNGVYLFSDVSIKEGKLLEYSYVVQTGNPSEKFVIPNSDVDISTLYVTVQKSNNDATLESFIRATDISNYDGDSNIFFIEENALGNYELFFGDGILGKKLVAGNIVTIRYLVSSGTNGNVSNVIDQSFTAAAPIGGSTTVAVTTVQNSNGGTAREFIDSIRFNAPRANLAKDRAVNKSDYQTLIKTYYPGIKSVSVWGGEENVPPAYGKVFITLAPEPGFVIDTGTKESIKNDLLKDRQILVVTPEFIDPEYTYLNLEVVLKYNKNLTTLPVTSIESLARTTVNNFFVNNVQAFGKNFYYSQLLEELNNCNPSIVSSNAEIAIQKRIIPILNVSNAYTDENTLNFNNRLHPGEIESTRFFISIGGDLIPVRLRDAPDTMPPSYDGTGTIVMYNPITMVTIDTIGTVNYATGEMKINGFTPVGFPTGVFDIRINAKLQENSTDVSVLRNQVIDLDNTVAFEEANRVSGLTIQVTAV